MNCQMTQEFKEKTLYLSIWTLISFILLTITWTSYINKEIWSIDKRLTILEKQIQEKAWKDDLKIIEIQLRTVDEQLKEIKELIKKV